MRPVWVVVCLVTLVVAPLSGCFGAEEIVSERTVTASGGRVSPGWAYDGVGVAAAGASLTATFLNAENTGLVEVAFQHAGSEWTVTFDQFAEASGKTFMDGGIAFDLDEHGDSGVSDASVPRILALVAAWGTATVTRDGAPVVGAAGERWSAHVMVSATTVRNAAGKIVKTDGATPYDPASPADATRVEGDPQVLLKLVHPDGETAVRAPVPVTGAADFAGPEATQTIDIPLDGGARAVGLNITSAPTQAGIGVGDWTARLLDATGAVLTSVTGSIAGPEGSVSALAAEVADVAGPLTLELTGQGAFRLAVDGAVAYDDHPLLVLTWDDPAIA